MTLAAAPPDLALTAAGDLLRRKSAVQGRVPLPRNLGHQGCKVVEPRQSLAPGTVGAARAVGAGVDGRLVGVALFTAPPNPFFLPAGDHLRRQGAVEVRAPFLFQFRHFDGHIRLAGNHVLAGAVGAAAARFGKAVHRGAPAMALFAPPPHVLVGPGGDALGREGGILFTVPKGGDFRRGGGKVCLPHNGALARAIGTAPAKIRPGVNGGVIAVAPSTAPPDLVPGGGGQGFGRQGILLSVPFFGKGGVCPKNILQRHRHVLSGGAGVSPCAAAASQAGQTMRPSGMIWPQIIQRSSMAALLSGRNSHFVRKAGGKGHSTPCRQLYIYHDSTAFPVCHYLFGSFLVQLFSFWHAKGADERTNFRAMEIRLFTAPFFRCSVLVGFFFCARGGKSKG